MYLMKSYDILHAALHETSIRHRPRVLLPEMDPDRALHKRCYPAGRIRSFPVEGFARDSASNQQVIHAAGFDCSSLHE